MSIRYNGQELPPGWSVYRTDDGRPYFHHRLTSTTQWDPPSLKSTLTGTSTTASSVGPVLRDEDEEDRMNGYGATDGEIATTTKGGRIQFTTTTGKKKKGYTSLPIDLNGPIDLESGNKTELSPTSVSGQLSETNQQQRSIAESSFLFYFININHLQQFFDIDSKSVGNRILASMLPYKVLQEVTALTTSNSSPPPSVNHILTSIRASPDLYGPFWIPTSLIFFMFVCSNIAAFISGKMIQTNFLALVIAFSMLYGYIFAIPLIIWALTLFLGGSNERQSITIRQVIAVYGYSFAVALPIGLLSLIPSMVVRWLLAAVGSGISLLFLLFNFKRDLIEAEPTFKLGVLGVFVIAQISFYASFPLYYFNV